MDIQIKKNEALIVLASSVKLSIKETESKILNYLKKDNKYISTEACGLSIVEISEMQGFEIAHLMNFCFYIHPKNTEIKELLEAIYIWGFGKCPECGCELEIEEETESTFTYKNYSCTNCDFKDNDCPDFDSMPGGHDDY